MWSVFVQEQGLMLCFLVEGEAKLSLLKVRIEGCLWARCMYCSDRLAQWEILVIFPRNYCLIFTTLAQCTNNVPAHDVKPIILQYEGIGKCLQSSKFEVQSPLKHSAVSSLYFFPRMFGLKFVFAFLHCRSNSPNVLVIFQKGVGISLNGIEIEFWLQIYLCCSP